MKPQRHFVGALVACPDASAQLSMRCSQGAQNRFLPTSLITAAVLQYRCYACQRHSRAYLHHLLQTQEMLAQVCGHLMHAFQMHSVCNLAKSSRFLALVHIGKTCMLAEFNQASCFHDGLLQANESCQVFFAHAVSQIQQAFA